MPSTRQRAGRFAGRAVAVAGDHLEHGLRADILDKVAGGHGPDAHGGRLDIGDVDAVHQLGDELRFLHKVSHIHALGGADLACDDETCQTAGPVAGSFFSPRWAEGGRPGWICASLGGM